MKDWVECVPNISEGRRKEVLLAISQAAERTGVRVLGMEADPDHNRAVLTMAGPIRVVMDAAYAVAESAIQRIDMREHHGAHPRIGAVDVIPFIPLFSTSMAVAIEGSRKLGQRLGDGLGLPVYLYNQSASRPEHRRLADIRRGQFEGLSAHIKQDPPDFGPCLPHLTAGAVAVGARRPLIAFNCYLTTEDVNIARAIAHQVRGSSGGLVGVQALAIHTVSQGMVQVSMNLVDYPTTTLPQALEMVRREANRFGVAVARCELIGLMPLAAVIDTAQYYLQCALSPEKVIEMAFVQGTYSSASGIVPG